tara:strand:- start:9076 stop:10011 length:936 start_codon:yes stop_codon:yes gene_type:complete
MKIAVSATSFCKNRILRLELLKHFPKTKFLMSHGVPSYDELISFYEDAEGLIVGTEKVDRNLLEQFPHIKIISKYGVGIDNIDLNALNNLNIKLGFTAGVNKLSVAELTLGFMLALSHNMFLKGLPLKSGTWEKNGGIQLSNRSVGIIGCGNVGYQLIELLKPFQCKILINDIEDKQSLIKSHGAKQVSKDEIFEKCQFITLHLPLTNQTKYLINHERLKRMRNDAFIVNTARGQLINQLALKQALIDNQIAGAALDVYEIEPPVDIEFLSLPQLITTPHIGGNSVEAQLNMGRSAIKHLVSFFKNETTIT